MRAIVAESADQLTWQEIPDIAPDDGEVLIKVSAAAVNRADLLQAAGNYPPPPGASQILGTRGVRDHRRSRRRSSAMGRRATSLRFAGRRRLCRVRRCPRRSGDADPRRCAASSCRGTARGGLHGVVEPGDDRASVGRSTSPDPRRQQRHRHARHPGGARDRRQSGRHRGVAGQTRPVRRIGRRDHHRLPRRGLRRAGRAAKAAPM